MKKLMLICLAVLTVPSVQAQFLSQEAIGGAALGGLAGGIIGHNNGRKTAEGAAIGAGAGLLLGGLVHTSRESQYYNTQPPVPAGGGYYQSSRPNYAITGAAVGGVAGAVIGNNQGHKTMEGAAIGVGAGLVLGAVAEQHARQQERSVVAYQRPVVGYYTTPAYVVAPQTTVSAPAAPAPQNVTIINNYYGSSGSTLSGANGLFGR